MDKLRFATLAGVALVAGMAGMSLSAAFADPPDAVPESTYTPTCERIAGGTGNTYSRNLQTWMTEQKQAGAQTFISANAQLRHWCAY